MTDSIRILKNAPRRTAKKVDRSDRVFRTCLTVIGAAYVLLIILLIVADAGYMLQQTFQAENRGGAIDLLVHNPVMDALRKPEIQYSILLTMVSCTVSAFLSLFVAVPLAYLLTRTSFPGKNLIDSILDIPIVLPPLVVGLSLLILFQFWPFTAKLGSFLPFDTPWDDTSLNSLIVYQIPAVIIAQFTVAAAFAVRTMKATFDQMNPRYETVALSLGCSRYQAFRHVVLPEASAGMLTALTLSWARSLGEFGPLLIFAGATRNKTEVLSTTVFLELSIGDLEAAVAVSLIMVAAAVLVLVITRMWGKKDMIL